MEPQAIFGLQFVLSLLLFALLSKWEIAPRAPYAPALFDRIPHSTDASAALTWHSLSKRRCLPCDAIAPGCSGEASGYSALR